MKAATGCVSLAAAGASNAITVERLIESCSATEESCTIWVDVFLTNRSSQPAEVSILHRGGFTGTDVTIESWLSAQGFEGVLADRIRRLHKSYCPVAILETGHVLMNGQEYTVPSACDGYTVRQIVGGNSTKKPPFTLWSVGPVSPGRTLFRMRLQMSNATFDSQIDRRNGFTAYGEAILLEKIQSDDLPTYHEADRHEYETSLRTFLAYDRIVPETFEYLLVTPEETTLQWETTPLSSRIIQPTINVPRLDRCTKWFVADDSATWFLSTRPSKPYSTFGLRMTRSVESADVDEPAGVL